MSWKLIVAFIVGVFALLALPFLLIGMLGSLIFDSWFMAILLVPVVLVAMLVLGLYRNWRRFSNFARGGDPALKRRGVQAVATLLHVQAMPVPMQPEGAPRRTIHAVKLRALAPTGGLIEFASFRTAEAILDPPRAGDAVTVYMDPKQPSRVFVDWATLIAGGGTVFDPETIDGEVVDVEDDVVMPAALPGRDTGTARARINGFTPQPNGTYTLDLRITPRDRPPYDTVVDVAIPPQQAESLAVGRTVRLVSDPQDPDRIEIAWD